MSGNKTLRRRDASGRKSRFQVHGSLVERVAVASALSGVYLASAGVMPVNAQSVNQQEVQLPPVIIEGGSLAKPKVKPKAVKPVVEEVASGAQQSKKIKPQAKKLQSDEFGADGQPTSGPNLANDGAMALDGDAGASTNAGVEWGVGADTLGTSVSVVTRDQIIAEQERTGADALRGLPGVSVNQQGGAGNVSVVRIRGAESNHTLVLIDGVEVNSGIDGFFDFANLATDDIARIEVLRGPQSGLYGSGALDGVVNIITESGKGPARCRTAGSRGALPPEGREASASRPSSARLAHG